MSVSIRSVAGRYYKWYAAFGATDAKLFEAGPVAETLWARMMAHAASRQTNGRVLDEKMPGLYQSLNLTGLVPMPTLDELTGRLVKEGLIRKDGAAWQLDWTGQLLAEDAARQRAKWKEDKKRARGQPTARGRYRT